MHTKTEGSRGLTYNSAWSVDDEDEQSNGLASIAEEYASRVAVDVADRALQVHEVSGTSTASTSNTATATPR